MNDVRLSSDPIFVINSEDMAADFPSGRALVVRVSAPQEIADICRDYGGRADLREFICVCDGLSLEDIEIDPAWGCNKVTFVLSGLGRYASVWNKLQQLCHTAVTLLYTGVNAVRDARITASLDVDTGVVLTPDMDISDELIELVTYTFYGKVAHGDVQPFCFLADRYSNTTLLSPALYYHVEPGLYYHLDQQRNMAVSHDALLQGEFVCRGLDAIAGCEAAVEEQKSAWQRLLVEKTICASCPAFRVCSGFFEPQSDKGRCRELMTELLEGIEFRRSME